MIKRKVLAKHVYIFLIISGTICIIRRNQPIRACQGQPSDLPHLQELTSEKNDIGEQSHFSMNEDEKGDCFYLFKFAFSVQRHILMTPVVDSSVKFNISFLDCLCPQVAKQWSSPKGGQWSKFDHMQHDIIFKSIKKSPRCFIHVFLKVLSVYWSALWLAHLKLAVLWAIHLILKHNFLRTVKSRLCILLHFFCLHKSKHLGPSPKLISASAFATLPGFWSAWPPNKKALLRESNSY